MSETATVRERESKLSTFWWLISCRDMAALIRYACLGVACNCRSFCGMNVCKPRQYYCTVLRCTHFCFTLYSLYSNSFCYKWNFNEWCRFPYIHASLIYVRCATENTDNIYRKKFSVICTRRSLSLPLALSVRNCSVSFCMQTKLNESKTNNNNNACKLN